MDTKPFQVYDGGGTINRSGGPRSDLLIIGQKQEITQSGLESRETESNLRTSTSANLAGGKQLHADGKQDKIWTERETDFRVLGSTTGPEAEPTEVCGPEMKKNSIEILSGASSGLTKELVHPLQVQTSYPCSETDCVGTEEQALSSATLQHCTAQQDLIKDELVFPRAMWKFGRISYSSSDSPGLAMSSNCPHIMGPENCDDSLRHIVQPFVHVLGD